MAGYGTDDAFTTWLTDNGYSLPVGAPSKAVLRQRGGVYIDATYGARFKGQPTAGFDQERAWPRSGAVVNGSPVPDNAVPAAVIQASYMAALQIANDPASLSNVGSGAGIVKRERVEGAVEVEYQDASKAVSAAPYDPYSPPVTTPLISEVEGMLAPYLVLPVKMIGVLAVGP